MKADVCGELRQKVSGGYGQLPLSFEKNPGQSDSYVKLLVRVPWLHFH